MNLKLRLKFILYMKFIARFEFLEKNLQKLYFQTSERYSGDQQVGPPSFPYMLLLTTNHINFFPQ